MAGVGRRLFNCPTRCFFDRPETHVWKIGMDGTPFAAEYAHYSTELDRRFTGRDGRDLEVTGFPR
jgi:hypothetical protein